MLPGLTTFRRSPILRLVGISFFACFVVAFSSAQVMGSYGHPDGPRVVNTTEPDTGVVTFKVYTEKIGARLDRQAIVKLENLGNKTDSWRATDENSECVIADVAYGAYSAEVSAVGYLSTHQELRVVRTQQILEFDIVLHRDPTAVNLDVADNMLSAKARKATKRAITALKSGDLKNAQKHLDEASRIAPGSSELNFLQGYLYVEKKDFGRAASYLNTATTQNSQNGQAFTLLGRVRLENQDYPAARSALEQAVLMDAENWLPHDLLADTYLHQNDYGKARDEARIALAKGKEEASSAQIILAAALANLGQAQQGLQELKAFLQKSPADPMVGHAMDLIASIETAMGKPPITKAPAGAETPAATDESTNATLAEQKPGVKLFGIDPIKSLPSPKLLMKAWEPPSVDDVKLSVAPDVPCPEGQVLYESGKRVQELVDDVARFAAIEDLFHQSLDEYGNPTRTDNRKYDYVASISEPQPGFLSVDEYRTDRRLTVDGYPDGIASSGFAALALVFHPDMRVNFEFTCEGLGDWHGQASWLVHFRQRDDRPNRMHHYKVGGQSYPVDIKGRAWITADKFQIVRIEADMTKPLPEIQLRSEHQVVEYGPIPFPKKNTTLWLPKSAEIYFDFRKHRYYRRHSFDHYMLYSVDTEEERKVPGQKPEKISQM